MLILSRKIGERMTERNARRLEDMIRGRSTEAQRWAAIQARIGGAPRNLGVLRSGLLGGLYASPQMRGILPLDQIAQ